MLNWCEGDGGGGGLVCTEVGRGGTSGLAGESETRHEMPEAMRGFRRQLLLASHDGIIQNIKRPPAGIPSLAR